MSSPRKIFGQLAERLVAKLDGPKSDGGVAPVFARMELTKCQNGLAVSLFVECDCHDVPRPYDYDDATTPKKALAPPKVS